MASSNPKPILGNGWYVEISSSKIPQFSNMTFTLRDSENGSELIEIYKEDEYFDSFGLENDNPINYKFNECGHYIISNGNATLTRWSVEEPYFNFMDVETLFVNGGEIRRLEDSFGQTLFNNPNGYIFYDECNSADGLTNYSNIRLLENGGSTTLSLEYDSTENAYKWTCRSGKAVILGIDALDGVTSDFRLTCQLKKTTSSHFIGLGYAQTELTGFGYGSDGDVWKGHFYSNGLYTGGITNKKQSSSANTWYCIELIKQGTNIIINCYDSTKTTLYANTHPTYSDDDNYFGIMSFNDGGVFFIKNIMAELI